MKTKWDKLAELQRWDNLRKLDALSKATGQKSGNTQRVAFSKLLHRKLFWFVIAIIVAIILFFIFWKYIVIAIALTAAGFLLFFILLYIVRSAPTRPRHDGPITIVPNPFNSKRTRDGNVIRINPKGIGMVVPKVNQKGADFITGAPGMRKQQEDAMRRLKRQQEQDMHRNLGGMRKQQEDAMRKTKKRLWG